MTNLAYLIEGLKAGMYDVPPSTAELLQQAVDALSAAEPSQAEQMVRKSMADFGDGCILYRRVEWILMADDGALLDKESNTQEIARRPAAPPAVSALPAEPKHDAIDRRIALEQSAAFDCSPGHEVAAAAEPKQPEPVAWMYTDPLGRTRVWIERRGGSKDWIETPLYAAPPAAEQQKQTTGEDEQVERQPGMYIAGLLRQVATLTAERLEQATEILSLAAERDQLQCDYQRIISEVLACNPQPASSRIDDQLEPPWEVIARVRAVEALRDAWGRMDRARAILTNNNPRPECNWGMLDTTQDRAALAVSLQKDTDHQPLDSEAKPE